MSSRNKRRGLGQGLGALFPGTLEETAETASAPQEPSEEGRSPSAGYREVPIGSILPNPYQPRTQLDEEPLDELAASIREHGIIQPLIVTQIEEGAVGERFQLIAGERRWRAARRAGLEMVPVVIKEATEREMLELAIIENIQRADLNPIEEAAAFQQMADFSNMTQNEIAERVGKSRTAVANTMRLLKLPDPIQDLVRQGRLSEGHARALLGLSSASEMMDAAERIMRRGMTVRQAEELVRHLLAPRPDGASPERTLNLHDRELIRQFTSVLGTRVEMKRLKKGGHLVIHFENDEDLQSIYDNLVSE
jgi:ParB family transcriptional regulator, chromosome partitioning protein